MGQQRGTQAPEHVDRDRIDDHLNSTYVGLLQCLCIHICVPCVQASEYKVSVNCVLCAETSIHVQSLAQISGLVLPFLLPPGSPTRP